MKRKRGRPPKTLQGVSCPSCGRENVKRDGYRKTGKSIGKPLFRCKEIGCRRGWVDGTNRNNATKEALYRDFPYIQNPKTRCSAAKSNSLPTILGLARRARVTRQTMHRWFKQWQSEGSPIPIECKVFSEADFETWLRSQSANVQTLDVQQELRNYIELAPLKAWEPSVWGQFSPVSTNAPPLAYEADAYVDDWPSALDVYIRNLQNRINHTS